MDPRKENLLRIIIESYIESAEPIGSEFLIANNKLDLSAATVRNEMRELEEEGYLKHPHTSAGRVPTEKGYYYYVKNMLHPSAPRKRAVAELEEIQTQDADFDRKIKNMGRYVAGYLQNAVIIAYGDDNVYYTGLANLFSQPEFQESGSAVRVSIMFDECEERITELARLINATDSQILLGANNPLGANCASVSVRLGDAVFTIVGPLRIDYNRSLGIIDYIKELINK